MSTEADSERERRPPSRKSEEKDQRIEPPHSIFSRAEKYYIVGLVSFAGLFSPLSANIYLPAIPTIADAFHTTVELINLSVTVYMVCQAVSPMLLGTLGDYLGRRPLFLTCLLVLAASCVGLALMPTSSYALLMVLRCIQAFGSASTVALGAGVVSDISSPEERGSLFGLYNAGPLFAPCLAPIIGAGLTDGLSWRAIFWFLCIGSGISVVVLLLFLPETLRSIVGNGSIKPKHFIHQPVVRLFGQHVPETSMSQLGSSRKFRNPLAMFLEPDIDLLLLVNGVVYAAFYGVTASISILFQRLYPFLTVTKIGLCYLPLGGGMIVGTVLCGRILDRDFERYKRKYTERLRESGKELQGDVTCHREFPLEKARLRLPPLMLAVLVASIIGFGRSVDQGVNLGVPLVLLLIMGCVSIAFMTVTSTMLIDLAPNMGSSITACNNIVRCGLGAACVAVVELMFQAMGVGWTYVVLGGLCGLMGPLIMLIVKLGPMCRARRQRREQVNTNA